MIISSIRTAGLGDTSYVVAHEGVGLVIDPQRDLDRFETELESVEAELGLVLETHLHNDYLSGGRYLAKNHAAPYVLPAASGAAFAYTPAFHHEDLSVGALTVRPIHTPGHTPEHTSYLVLVDGVQAALFSGGSLLVGSAGRTDLLGADRARQLARLQYQSVTRLAGLGDEVELYPTHGEGSFCASTAAGRSASTIGIERRTNPVLQHDNADEFADSLLSGLAPYPSYYSHMGTMNLLGPPPEPDHALPRLAVGDIPEEATVIDIRSKAEFASGHLAGSIGIPTRDDTGVWTGWIVAFGTPIVLVAGTNQDATEISVQLARIGYDDVLGVVTDLGETELVSYRTVDVGEFVDALDAGGLQMIDVRSHAEWETGHVEGSKHRYLPYIPGSPLGLDRDREMWIACESGQRATIAAGLVEEAGYRPVVLSEGGVPEILGHKRDL
ncbi:MAG: MBL fold metallo-hydrolase [Acidimicrobiia bacterium]|nr:MAG: MBL fold metallo-hydrolase [Acidimicrobiia bacterium]